LLELPMLGWEERRMTLTGDGHDTRQALSTLGSNELGVINALRGGQADGATLAAAAGISVSEVNKAIEVLQGLELVRSAPAEECEGCFELNQEGLRSFLSQVQASST
jgi:hypothetical protein